MSENSLFFNEIINDIDNLEFKEKGWIPIYNINENSKILIIGQAPGINAQEKEKAWDDKSGELLRKWLNVSEDEFYNANIFGILPMDFFFPGKGKVGDLAPRKKFYEKWHSKILNKLKDAKLIILLGNYSQKYYLKEKYMKNLTENVKNYKKFSPKYIPLPHPSPLNFRWFNKNPWFYDEVIPYLREKIEKILNNN